MKTKPRPRPVAPTTDGPDSDNRGDWIVICTDHRHCGQPLRALTRSGLHLDKESYYKRFARFATKEEAEAWMRAHPELLSRRDWCYTVVAI